MIGFIFLPNIFLPCTCVFSSGAVQPSDARHRFVPVTKPSHNSIFSSVPLCLRERPLYFLAENDRGSVRAHRVCKVGGEEYLSGCCVMSGLAGAAPWDGEKLAVGRRWVVFRYFKTVTPQRIRVVAKSHDTKERNSGYSFKPITDC